MRKLSFQYIEKTEKNLLRSFLRLLDKTKQFDVIENFDTDNSIELLFINYNDSQSLEFIEKTANKNSFIIVTSLPLSFDEESKLLKNHRNTILTRPISLQKISTILDKYKTDSSIISHNSNNNNADKISSLSKHILQQDHNKNFVLQKNEQICLVSHDTKEIHHNIEYNQFNAWLTDPELIVQETSCPTDYLIQSHGLHQNFVYEGFYYLLHNQCQYHNIVENNFLTLKKFPNIFPQAEFYRQDLEPFYQICFYLSKKERNVKDIAINLAIPIDYVLTCLNSLHHLGFINVIEHVPVKPPVSNVKSIFSKLKLALGM